MPITKTSNLTSKHYIQPAEYLRQSDKDLKKIFTELSQGVTLNVPIPSGVLKFVDGLFVGLG